MAIGWQITLMNAQKRDDEKNRGSWRNAIMWGAIVAGLAFYLSAPKPALAQTAAPTLPDAPFIKDLERLAEILGSIHYLEAVCSTDGLSPWRRHMQSLIETEFRSEELKKRAVARFNLGYQSYANIHTACSTAAEVTLNRFLNEGAQIADDVVKRYGR